MKLEGCPTWCWKLYDRIFTYLDKTPECDGRTDRQTDRILWLLQLVTMRVKSLEYSHRLDVEEENFIEERRNIGEIRVQAPVDTEIGDDDRPDRSWREYVAPRHLTQLSTDIHSAPVKRNVTWLVTRTVLRCNRHIIWDETFQAIDCTGSDNRRHAMPKKTNAKKTAVAKTNVTLQNPGLVAFYNIRLGHSAK